MAKKEYKLTEEQYAKLCVVTPIATGSFPHIFEKGEYQGKETNYGITLLIPKTAPLLKDDEGMKEIRLRLTTAKIFQWGKDPKKWPKGMNSPISDGDDSKYPEEKGHWIVKATTNDDLIERGAVVDKNGQEILEKKEIYGGIKVRAHIQAATYELSAKNLGTKFYLKALKKVADGKKLGAGKSSAAKAFEAFDDGDVDDGASDEGEDNYEM